MEVTFTHGYDPVPADLVALVADVATRLPAPGDVREKKIGRLSTSSANRRSIGMNWRRSTTTRFFRSDGVGDASSWWAAGMRTGLFWSPRRRSRRARLLLVRRHAGPPVTIRRWR